MIHLEIINWYHKHKRCLPWRNTKDPYFIWISEVMLQQTRVSTAILYFNRFVQRFPSLYHLAKADEREVLNLWQGLGYYSRARNLHQAAKTIANKHQGIFPNNYNDILQLKGVGTYTAAAIASFSYNLPYAVLDGNVFRVLSRLFGIETPIDSTKGKRLFSEIATETMGNASPEIYNQAIIEFGALQCTPKSPNCTECPLRETCYACRNHCVLEFPKKSKRIKPKNRYFYYLFLSYENKFAIEKREENDIWKNLYQYPLIETAQERSINQLLKTQNWENILSNTKLSIQSVSHQIIHKLTHQNIKAKIIHLTLHEASKTKAFIFVSKQEAEQYPFPKLIENHLKTIII